MTDPNEIIDGYKRYCEALSTANRMNKATLFELLGSAGITTVTAEFDGEGDSGQIQDIRALSGDATTSLPEASITLHQASYGTGKMDSAESSLREAIETICYGYLEQEHGGWENNDGAFGEFTFKVAERTIDLEFNGRFVDFVSSSYSL